MFDKKYIYTLVGTSFLAAGITALISAHLIDFCSLEGAIGLALILCGGLILKGIKNV